MGLVIRVQVVAGQRAVCLLTRTRLPHKSSMPPPPQVLALGGAAAAAGVGYALLRARERAASEAAKADEARMNEELQRNRERFEEAKQVREEAMEKLHRGGRRNQRRAAPQDFRELATDRYDDKFAAELWRLGDTLRKAQVASLASQPLFAALPLVGRPEDPRWVELFVLLIWTGGTPKSRAFAQNHGELLLEHLTQGLGGGASCVTAFSHPHIVQWLRELCELQHTDERNETVSVPAFLELTLWRACYSAQFGEPVMWDLPQGFNHKHAESLEPWLREDLGLYLRDASTFFLDRADHIMSLDQYAKAKVRVRVRARARARARARVSGVTCVACGMALADSAKAAGVMLPTINAWQVPAPLSRPAVRVTFALLRGCTPRGEPCGGAIAAESFASSSRLASCSRGVERVVAASAAFLRASASSAARSRSACSTYSAGIAPRGDGGSGRRRRAGPAAGKVTWCHATGGMPPRPCRLRCVNGA